MPDRDYDLIHMRAMRGDVDAWTIYQARMKLGNGPSFEGASAPVAWLDKNNWTRGYGNPSLWPRLQAAFRAGYTVEITFDRT